jgi:hypothetical protein
MTGGVDEIIEAAGTICLIAAAISLAASGAIGIHAWVVAATGAWSPGTKRRLGGEHLRST